MSDNSRVGRIKSRQYKKYNKDKGEEELGFFESLCKWASNYVVYSPGGQLGEDWRKNIRISRLKVDEEEIGGLLLFSWMLSLPLLIPLLINFFLPLTLLLVGSLSFWSYYIISYPSFRAQVTKVKSSDEALNVILYMALSLEVNPNLEKAFRTVVKHSDGPISQDFLDILWKLEMGVYSTIEEGISDFTSLWREWNPDFVKSLEFLIDSMKRTGESRKHMIRKGQKYIINSSRVKMEKYARELSMPVKIIYMLGVVMPVMGLIMFPMISTFLGDQFNSIYLMFGYVVVLPFILYFVISRLIPKRPGAFSAPSLENVKGLPPKDKLVTRFGNVSLKKVAVVVAFLIMIPGLIQVGDLTSELLSQGSEQQFKDYVSERYSDYETLRFNIITSLTIIWGIVGGMIVYFEGRSYIRRKKRDHIMEIEDNMDLGLTELENSLSRGVPMEKAVEEVSTKYEELGQGETPVHNFFEKISRNIRRGAPDFDTAVFGKGIGAIHDYPSPLLINVMNLISNSLSKGVKSVTKRIKAINEYIENSKEIENLVRNILDEVSSSLLFQARFIAPLVSGVAVALSTTIIQVMTEIGSSVSDGSGGGGGMFGGNFESVASSGGIFSAFKSFEKLIPPSYSVLIIGIYMIEVVTILSFFMAGIKHGFDEIYRDQTIARNLFYGTLVFTAVIIASVIFILGFISQTIQI